MRGELAAGVIALAFLFAGGVVGCQNDASTGKMAQTAEPPGEAQLAVAKVSSEPQQEQQRGGGLLEPVAHISGPMPTGVTVSHDGRIFLCFPRWRDPVQFTVAELKATQLVPYPDPEINRLNMERPGETLVSVQSVVVDPDNRLWLLDTGNINMGENLPQGPKLVCIDLSSNRIVRTLHFPEDVALPTTYLNDVRFDLRQREGGVAYITDSSGPGPNGIIVVDLASGRSWRKLHDHPSTQHQQDFTPIVEGEKLLVRQPLQPPKPPDIGSDGIALSHDGQTLYYRPLVSRHLYSVPTQLLLDPEAPDDRLGSAVRDHGDIGFCSDGLEFDAQGRLYLTDYENQAVRRTDPSAQPLNLEIVASDPEMIWPDTLSLAGDGNLYIVVNQLNRQPQFHNGKDLRQPPYALMRIRTDGTPVRLK